MMKLKTISTLVFAVTAGVVFAKKPHTDPVIGPDLAAKSLSMKTKCKDFTCSVKNFRLNVRNEGDADAPNSRVTFYLSLDDVLTTQADELNPVADTLIHTQALGKVKAGRLKKRNVGGGLLKKANALPGNYIIAVLDSDDTLLEADEFNNILVSDPIP